MRDESENWHREKITGRETIYAPQLVSDLSLS